MKENCLFICFLIIGQFLMFSQQSEMVNGPIIHDYGASYEVDHPEIATETSSELKVIFDIDKSPDDKTEINKWLEVAARFLNMHAHAGMNPGQLKAAMTIHAEAAKDVLNNAAYKARFGVDNPNLKLIKAMSDAGVDIIICGQSAAKNKMSRDDIDPNVKIALSATTALLQYQNIGYHFVKY